MSVVPNPGARTVRGREGVGGGTFRLTIDCDVSIACTGWQAKKTFCVLVGGGVWWGVSGSTLDHRL